VGPSRQFLFGLDEAPCPARFCSFLTRSSEFFIFSGLVPGLLGVMFTSLLDFYWASRSCHELLNELIPEVLLSTLKSCITLNSKTNMHKRTCYNQWIRYKIHANTEGKFMARLTELHRQHLPMLKPCSSSSKTLMDIIVALHCLNLALDHTRENIMLSKNLFVKVS
jgi:hypothetical protein